MTKYIDKPITPMQRHAYCDCGGSLKYDGVCLTTAPAKYVHTCSDCGERVTLDATYPCLIYREALVGEKEDG